MSKKLTIYSVDSITFPSAGVSRAVVHNYIFLLFSTRGIIEQTIVQGHHACLQYKQHIPAILLFMHAVKLCSYT